MAACTAGKDSASSCECFIHKYQLRDVEEGHAIAELLSVEVSVKRHLKLARRSGVRVRARQYAAECHAAVI